MLKINQDRFLNYKKSFYKTFTKRALVEKTSQDVALQLSKKNVSFGSFGLK